MSHKNLKFDLQIFKFFIFALSFLKHSPRTHCLNERPHHSPVSGDISWRISLWLALSPSSSTVKLISESHRFYLLNFLILGPFPFIFMPLPSFMFCVLLYPHLLPNYSSSPLNVLPDSRPDPWKFILITSQTLSTLLSLSEPHMPYM